MRFSMRGMTKIRMPASSEIKGVRPRCRFIAFPMWLIFKMISNADDAVLTPNRWCAGAHILKKTMRSSPFNYQRDQIVMSMNSPR